MGQIISPRSHCLPTAVLVRLLRVGILALVEPKIEPVYIALQGHITVPRLDQFVSIVLHYDHFDRLSQNGERREPFPFVRESCSGLSATMRIGVLTLSTLNPAARSIQRRPPVPNGLYPSYTDSTLRFRPIACPNQNVSPVTCIPAILNGGCCKCQLGMRQANLT